MFIAPTSINADERRQEYILNILQAGLLSIAVLAFVMSGISFLTVNSPHNHNSFATTSIFAAFVLGLVLISRRGHYKISTYLFIAVLSVATLQLLLQWGFMLPQVQLALAMVIVIAGVLLSSRAALIFTAGVSLLLLGVSYGQVHHHLKPDLSWLDKPFFVGDAIGYVVVFIIIGIVSWLSNRETDRSLDRARASEAALATERDNLEIKVLQRTQELEQAQLVRTMELQRFAEFGRLNAHLLHELSNPLTAVSLNLQQMPEQKSALVSQARENMQHLERYVDAARKQLQQESAVGIFSIPNEVEQLNRILKPLAQHSGVTLSLHTPKKASLYGDPVKFNQLVSNLIVNAIDAYQGIERRRSAKEVTLTIKRHRDQYILTVQDNGKGITAEQIEHIFTPFYTTKSGKSRGMGIGLSLVKQMTEHDFGGTISVSSSAADGTRFVITMLAKQA